jgi:tetratricopeptide (TPR) repeat protein
MGAPDRAAIFEPTQSLTRGQRAVEAFRFEEAREAYSTALQYAPESLDALRGLGYSLLQLGNLAGSLEALERALQADSSDLLTRLLMGRLFLRLQQPRGAAEHFQSILERIPASEAARSGLMDALVAQGDLAGAVEQSQDLLKSNPKSEVANLCAARLAGLQGDDVRALRHFETLVELRPGNPVHLYNRGLCLLRLGRFAPGWRDYEFRFAAGAVSQRLPSTPRWDGRPVERLLVVCEQGLGDTLLFSRFLADAARFAQEIVVACPESLCGLLARNFRVTCVSDKAPHWPHHEAHVPLMSLPHVLQLADGAAAARPPYLAADPDRKERWAAVLEKPGGATLRIGVVHATSVAHSTEQSPFTRRSCDAADLAPLLQAAPVIAYNLSLGRAAEEARGRLPGLQDLPGRIDDFDDTAAVVDLLDAVVSVDTACAHVAGAVGTPLFLLLPPSADWKWQPHAAHAPWYASVQRAPQPRTPGQAGGQMPELWSAFLRLASAAPKHN